MEKSTSFFTFRQSQYLTQEEVLETKRQRHSITIGLPAEDKSKENRIALTPQGVEILSTNGHKIIIEKGAGDGANYFDNEFSEAGAIIVDSKEEVYKQSEVILKITPPTLSEIELLNQGQLLMSFFYISHQDNNSFLKLASRRINALGFEFLKNDLNEYPVIRTISEIEGYTSVLLASEYLNKSNGGKGVLLGGITGVPPSSVVIIGANTAGEFATRAALGLGCQVKVFDNSYKRLRDIEKNVGQRLYTSMLHPQSLNKALQTADAVIASLRAVDSGKVFITKEQISKMKRGAVIVDLSVGEVGCFETEKSDYFSNEPFIDEYGVIQCATLNLSSRVSKTASIALSNIFTPILLELGEHVDIHSLIKQNRTIANGTYIYKGILTNREIGERFSLPYNDIGLLLSAF